MVVGFSCGWDAKDENDEETFGLVRLMAGLAVGGGAEFHFIWLYPILISHSHSAHIIMVEKETDIRGVEMNAICT